jgi:hypothetical protein
LFVGHFRTAGEGGDRVVYEDVANLPRSVGRGGEYTLGDLFGRGAARTVAAKGAGDHGDAFRVRVTVVRAEFWLNVQRRSDLWEAMNSATDKARVERARPLSGAA